MVSDVVVAADEVSDPLFKITRQIIVLEQDAVLQGLVPAFNFPLGLGMHGCVTGVVHAFVAQPVCQFRRDVRRTIVTEQPWLVQDAHIITSCHFKR